MTQDAGFCERRAMLPNSVRGPVSARPMGRQRTGGAVSKWIFMQNAGLFLLRITMVATRITLRFSQQTGIFHAQVGRIAKTDFTVG
jgi:hypothetical protein